jgi:hypothetical protein
MMKCVVEVVASTPVTNVCHSSRLECLGVSGSLMGRPSTRTFSPVARISHEQTGGIDALPTNRTTVEKNVSEDVLKPNFVSFHSLGLTDYMQRPPKQSTGCENECQKNLTWCYFQNFVHHGTSTVVYHNKRQPEILHTKVGILPFTAPIVIVCFGHTRV